ncbi:MAG: glycosyltransferase [Bradyrhizobiaceae bacterium]|nr:glycosyltransferase [Bradyrhizobiaceae bacterium]
MKILIVHNYYQRPGGEDDVVANEKAMLIEHGHDVELLAVRNDQIQSFADKVKTAWNSSYSQQGYEHVAAAIRIFSPALVHVHNFFPLLSPSIYDACSDAGVPVVQTLHNYRLLCANGQLARNAIPCEKCVHGAHYWGVIHRCYQNSLLGSAVVARMLWTHRRHNTWREKVASYIAPSHFMKTKFVEAGLPDDRIHVKPNFVPEYPNLPPLDMAAPRKSALFAARFSREKGVDLVLQAWEELDFPLRMIGDGPLAELVREKATPAMTLIGWQPMDILVDELRRAEFLLMPSTWYEGFPVTLALALANGLPIIASRLGAMEEVVEDGKTGLLFTTGDVVDLRRKVSWAFNNPERMREMGANARTEYERKYSPNVNYAMLMGIYETVLKRGPDPYIRNAA